MRIPADNPKESEDFRTLVQWINLCNLSGQILAYADNAWKLLALLTFANEPANVDID